MHIKVLFFFLIDLYTRKKSKKVYVLFLSSAKLS